ncbi:Chromosome partition protein Smc [Marinomonas aquimarina]|uniref:Chromosome partition protein Smc n=1 Tax=Marinomonas aquimarina TaxID=295068 RepID=A0A1A8TH16_9GAMM|nr:hypothetical protein [Marinomonas aquimarina]SBS31929.1 Chromosome partition protein Smc [Marinomonas aquimarina]
MRKDDDVEIPSLTLDQDELSDRTPVAGAQKAGKQRLNPPPAKPAAATQAAAKKPSLGFVYLLLLLIIGGASAGGYWLWMENQKLRDELLGARSQIQDLDSQLVAADVSNSELGTTVEETLKTHESEIRKLWGVAYDRNRKAIATNDSQIELLETKLSELRDTVSTQGKRAAVQADAFNEIESGFNAMVKTVAALEATQTEQSTKVTQLSDEVVGKVSEQASTIAAQRDRIASLDQQLSALQQSLERLTSNVNQQAQGLDSLANASSTPQVPANLTSQLQNIDESIQSIDQFRPQVLREINSLKAQVRQLSLELSMANGG